MPTKPFDIVVDPVGSKFAKTLQQALQAKVVNIIYRRRTPKTVPAQRTITGYWGVLRAGRAQYVRDHFAITQQVLNKVEQFERFTAASVSCPGYCTEPLSVQNLGAKTVFARTLINSTNGRGIIEHVVGDGPIPVAPLYTAYIPKKAEYRFHVFNGEVIDVQEKRKKRGFEEDRNTRVRNVQNGYVYCRDNIVPPDGATALAVAAVSAVGYQYGAVDLIYNEKRGQCFVLEVNSRPGLMGTTLDKYVEALIKTYSLERK